MAAGVRKLNTGIWLAWKGRSFCSLRLEAAEVTREKAGMRLRLTAGLGGPAGAPGISSQDVTDPS